MPVKKILTVSELTEIAEFLVERGFEKDILINIEVESPEMLKKINEDYFYKYSDSNSQMEDCDALNVNIYGVKFIYVVKNREN